MSLSTSNYKGILAAVALIGGSAALWFNRTDSAHVHAIDGAELVAGAKDCANELAGASVASTVFTCTGYEIDDTQTNDWGGYESFVISGTSWFSYGGNTESGTYVFSRREYGTFSIPGDTFEGGAFDVYTNTLGYFYVIDCGPGGAVETKPLSPNNRQIKDHSWLIGINGAHPNRTAVWSNITSQVFYPAAFGIYGPGTQYGYPITFTFSSPTYPTSGVSRVRHYSPHRLVTYTNTILQSFDINAINGIRSTVASCVNDGTAPCFIGPTNAGSTYDGVAAFPLVSTSAWRTVYTNWTGGGKALTNLTYRTNYLQNIFVTYADSSTDTINGIGNDRDGYHNAGGTWYWGSSYAQYAPVVPVGSVYYWYSTNGPSCTLDAYDVDFNPLPLEPTVSAETTTPVVVITTNIVQLPNESIFIKTNELAWHYSAMYRLRDARYGATTSSNRWFFSTASAATPGDAWDSINTRFGLGLDQGAGTFDPSPYFGGSLNGGTLQGSAIETTGTPGAYTVRVFMQRRVFSLENIYTNCVAKIEWYAKAFGTTNFSDYSATGLSTGVYKLIDSATVSGSSATTHVFDAWFMPPRSDASAGLSKGFGVSDVVPVLRWQQRACTNAIFDNRYP